MKKHLDINLLLVLLVGVFLIVFKDDYHTAYSLKAARILSVIATTVLYTKVWTILDGPIIFQGYMLFTLLAGATIDWMTEFQYSYKAVTKFSWPLYFISGTIPFSDLILKLFLEMEIINDSAITSNFSQYIPKLFVFFATQIVIAFFGQKKLAYLEWMHKIPEKYLMFCTLEVTEILEQYRQQPDYEPVETLLNKKVLINDVFVPLREPVVGEIVLSPVDRMKLRIRSTTSIKPTQYLQAIYNEMMDKKTQDVQLVETKFNEIFRDLLQCPENKIISDFKEAMFFSIQQFMQGAEFTLHRQTVIAIAQGYLNHQFNIVDQEEFLAMNTIIRAKMKILNGLKDHRACSPVVTERLYRFTDAKKAHQITQKLDSLRSSESIVNDVRETMNVVTEVNSQPGVDIRFTDTLGQQQYLKDYRETVVKSTFVKPQEFSQQYRDTAYQRIGLPRDKEQLLDKEKRQLSNDQMEQDFSQYRGVRDSAQCLKNMSFQQFVNTQIAKERQQQYQRAKGNRKPVEQMVNRDYSRNTNRDATIAYSYARKRNKSRERQESRISDDD